MLIIGVFGQYITVHFTNFCIHFFLLLDKTKVQKDSWFKISAKKVF